MYSHGYEYITVVSDVRFFRARWAPTSYKWNYSSYK